MTTTSSDQLSVHSAAVFYGLFHSQDKHYAVECQVSTELTGLSNLFSESAVFV